MSKVDIISGFLGAGKTTLIKKLINDCFKDEKIVLIENEFGEIGIDGSFLKEAGIEITEMNSGCICCSLVGDFSKALVKVVEIYHPDRIIIEPSGVGKLSDVIKAVLDTQCDELELNSYVTVIDAKKCKIYSKNFGEFFNNQVEYASTIILSRTQDLDVEHLYDTIDIIREYNDEATIITTPWDDLSGEAILNAIEYIDLLDDGDIYNYYGHDEECCCGHHEHEHDEECCCGHHHEHDEGCCCGHHEHDHDEECCCGHHEHEHDEECCCGHHEHEHDEECCCGHHHEHEHDEECCCGHHHEHEHDEECCCGHHHEHEHDEECCCGHHHADDVFTSIGMETINEYSIEQLEEILNHLSHEQLGYVLRAKGIVKSNQGYWLHFDYVPGEFEIRQGAADYTGRICVIGRDLNEDFIDELFGI